MPTLCSKPRNDFLDFLGFGSVGIGVRLPFWRKGRALGGLHPGRRLFCDPSLLLVWDVGLVEASTRHFAVRLAGLGLAPCHSVEE